jgi:branched-chain amino acid aminotransferase
MTRERNMTKNMGNVVWWNGEMIKPEDATLHIGAHTLHYGMGAFEGIRAYELDDRKTGIFRLEDHMRRFLNSCKTGMMPTPYGLEELNNACREVVRQSGFKSCYLRPIGFLDAGPLGVNFDRETHPFTIAIFTMQWGKYLGAEAAAKGTRLKVSSFTRHHPNISMTKAKLCGNYINSVLAKVEAVKLGFDEALMLDPEGYLAEGTGENLFVIRRGTVYTPSVETVLEGVTRDTVISIVKELKLPLVERRLTRDELYSADEAFLCGTAAEVTPVAEVDMRQIGAGRPGEITSEISKRYFDIVTGKDTKYSSWVDVV